MSKHQWSDDGYPVIDGREPEGIEHVCIKDPLGHTIEDGSVEDCCIDLWRAEGAPI